MYQSEATLDIDLGTEEYAPFRALWSAVLTTAFADLDDRNREIVADARKWIDSEDTSPQSYFWVCQILGVNPHDLRMICNTRHGRKILHKNNGRQRGGSTPVSDPE